MIRMKSKFFRETLGRSTVPIIGAGIVLLTLAISAFLIWKGSATFTVHHQSILNFLTGSYFDPAIEFNRNTGATGIAIFIVGSLLVSGLALLLATPFAVGCAIFIIEISPKLGKKLLQPAFEVFVGIPSVVYGWVGVTVLC